MKLANLITDRRITPLNAQNALDEVRQVMSDTEDNLRDTTQYIQQNPRAFGLTLVQSRRDEERSFLLSLRRREARCLRVITS
jgi:hypothetical protein